MPHVRTSKKPEGLPTRGKTASNRLRRVDNFILLYEPSLLMPGSNLFADAMFVDLGYGFDARTTLESAERFRRVNPNLKILGVEIDKERVEAALPFADEKTFFRLGGFNLPLKDGEHVRLIRAFNVLRQYEEKDFSPAYERLAEYVLPGGLMIEGTSNPFGSIWCANLVRRVESGGSPPKMQEQAPALQKWRFETLVFSTNFRLGFDPEEFQTILPKNLIHRVVKGEPIYDFFEAWKRSAAEMSAVKIYGDKQWFIATAERLVERGYDISTQRKWLNRGFLIWKRG
ncbi:MAG: class I SAM-dependent methyltransferase [Anaerolineales bacterium]